MTKRKIAKALHPTHRMLGIPPYSFKKGDSYMSPEQQTHFKKILIRWKQVLQQEVDTTVAHLKATVFPDPIDRASQEEEFSLELRSRERERHLIEKIDHALNALATQDYGFCEECGTQIGLRRLEARPTATKCIDCKNFEETKEKQSGLSS